MGHLKSPSPSPALFSAQRPLKIVKGMCPPSVSAFSSSTEPASTNNKKKAKKIGILSNSDYNIPGSQELRGSSIYFGNDFYKVIISGSLLKGNEKFLVLTIL